MRDARAMSLLTQLVATLRATNAVLRDVEQFGQDLPRAVRDALWLQRHTNEDLIRDAMDAACEGSTR